MSIFYDPRKRSPKPWTFFFFIVLTILIGVFIYAYGSYKAKDMPLEDVQSNSISEKDTE